MKNLNLPFPQSFMKYSNFDLNDDLPIWLRGCLQDQESKKIHHLFDDELKFIELDTLSIKAINEYSHLLIDIEELLKNAKLPKSLKKIESLNLDQSLKNSFLRNGIKDLNSLSKLEPKKIKQLPGLGKSKILAFLIYLESEGSDQTISSSKKSNEEKNDIFSQEPINKEGAKKLFSNYSQIPFEKIFIDDPRFLDIREIFYKYNLETSKDSENWQSLLGLTIDIVPEVEIKSALKKFKNKFNKITSLSLSGQMINFFESMKIKSQDKYLIPILDRIGVVESSSKTPTLEEVGKRLSVTRERIRQVEKKILRKFNHYQTPFIPGLENLKNTLSKNLYKHEEDICLNLSEQGFGDWNFNRILKCLDLFKVNHNFELKNKILSRSGNASTIAFCIKLAKRIIDYNGLVEKNQLIEILSQDYEINTNDISKVLDNNFECVYHNWYFHKNFKVGRSNLLVNLSARMSNFSSTFSIEDLREAHRKYKTLREPSFFANADKTSFWGFLTPPSESIRNLLSELDDFELTGNEIHSLLDGSKYMSDLNSADALFLNYFKARNFECSTDTEMKNFFIKGKVMKEGSFFLSLTYKPYLKKYAPRVYGVVGYPPSSVQLEDTSKRISKSLPTKIEWSEDGIICTKSVLGSVNSYVLAVNDHFLKFFDKDEFRVIHNGKEVGLMKRSKNTNFWYGLGPFLKNHLHCEIGDCIKVELDIQNYVATVFAISKEEYSQ